MTMKTKIAAAGLLALSALGLATTAARADSHDGMGDAAEAQAFAATQMTVAQAATAAEGQSGGRAMSVDFDAGDDGESTAYDVEVLLADGTTAELLVNPADGTVTPATEADDDGESGEGGEESEG